jgi:Tol biopolymer transport system component
MNSDGTGQTLLKAAGGFPSFSPQGTEIVYYSIDPEGTIGSLWIMNDDGTNVRQLTGPN